MHRSSDSGFSLIETVVASGVLAVGMLGAAAVFSHGMQKVTSAPGDLIATQKASEAIESVFSARDSHSLTWAQLRNVNGASGSDGGIFLDGPRSLTTPGPDGVVNTADDGPVETMTLPGPDQIYGTSDDQVIPLNQYQREIKIRDVEIDLRSITVTITYLVGSANRKYVLTTYISDYS